MIISGLPLIMLPDFFTSIQTGPSLVGSLLVPWTLRWLVGVPGLLLLNAAFTE